MLQTMPKNTVKAPPPPEAIKLRALREEKNLSRDKFAAKAGVHRNTIQKYETGERKLTLPVIDRLAPLLGKTRDDLISTDGIDRGESVSIPEGNVRVASSGAFEMDDTTRKDVWVLPRRYLMDELRVPPGKLIIHEVHSDSMAPTLVAGDRVLVNLEDQRINQPGIFLIADAHGDVLKRLETVPGSKPLLVKQSFDNSRHGSYEVPASATKVIGRVVWYARRM